MSITRLHTLSKLVGNDLQLGHVTADPLGRRPSRRAACQRLGEVIVNVSPRTDQGVTVWQQPQTQEELVNEQLRIEAIRAQANAKRRQEHEAALEIENAKARAALAERQRKIDEEEKRWGGG